MQKTKQKNNFISSRTIKSTFAYVKVFRLRNVLYIYIQNLFVISLNYIQDYNYF